MRLFGWSPSVKAAADGQGGEGALATLAAALAPRTFEALVDTCELPPGAATVGAGVLQDAAVRRLLRRFLAAEKGDPAKAAARLAAHAEWRVAAVGPGGMPDSEVAEQLTQAKVFLQPLGAKGRTLLIVRARAHRRAAAAPAAPAGQRRHPEPAGFESIKRLIVYGLDAAAALADQTESGKLWVLVDLAGLQVKNLDAQALRACFQVVRPFIDPDTQEKVRFVSGAAAAATYAELVGADCLPREFDGEAAEPRPVEAAVAALRAARRAAEGPTAAAAEAEMGERAAAGAAAAAGDAGEGSEGVEDEAAAGRRRSRDRARQQKLHHTQHAHSAPAHHHGHHAAHHKQQHGMDVDAAAAGAQAPAAR
eukprot:scaffold17.g507.t1